MINSKRIDKYIEIIDIAIRQVNFDTDDDTWKEDRDKIEDLMNNQTKTKTSSYIFSEGDDVNLLIVIHVKKVTNQAKDVLLTFPKSLIDQKINC